ncbi:MAG: DUF2251 domain-containing protein [Deltaproteobacteria bacterium]|nr:DUF2251 domain-containing protein [Deltaproteobacteria bacterium]
MSSEGFVVEGPGRSSLVAVFEDDGETGFLYVYDCAADKVTTHLHVYDRSPSLVVNEDDVFVTWTSDFSRCGVVIWGEMMGVIDVRTDKRWVTRAVSNGMPGLEGDALEGFERE